MDIVIGTHRLLQKDMGFRDLGLVVIDEEQRFGVKHKERMKQMRTEVHVLSMTATPIPRTLHMAMSGVRDISVIETPPEDRQPVLTFVGAQDDRQVTAAIHRELLRDGQVFYLHNRVESIERAARRLRDLVPEARVGGRARPDERGRPGEGDGRASGRRSTTSWSVPPSWSPASTSRTRTLSSSSGPTCSGCHSCTRSGAGSGAAGSGRTRTSSSHRRSR